MPNAPVSAVLRRRGPLAAANLRTALGVSAPTLSRLVANEDEVLRLGKGRATVYALSRAIRGLPARLPLFRVDARGEVRPAGEMLPLEPGGTWVEPHGQRWHRHVGLPP